MFEERRTETRVQLAMPVMLTNGIQGATRNISASGLLFTAKVTTRIGALIDLAVDLRRGRDIVRLVAHGRVIRIERGKEQTLVAVQMLASRLRAEHVQEA